jgi:hypothetical protein
MHDDVMGSQEGSHSVSDLSSKVRVLNRMGLRVEGEL